MTAHYLKCKVTTATATWAKMCEGTDGVFDYARRYFNLGMLYLAFREFIRYGDGPAAISVYKWILPLTRAQSVNAKYPMEALSLYALPARLIILRGTVSATFTTTMVLTYQTTCVSSKSIARAKTKSTTLAIKTCRLKPTRLAGRCESCTNV